MNEPKQDVTIYTDGGCLGNPGPGGYGVVLRCGRHEKRLSGGFARTTNNRMEIMAAIAGLEALKEPCRVTLHSDSKYLVNAMTQGWVQRWRGNGWKRNKKDKAVNVDLWQRLLSVCARHEVVFKWVKGHAGHPDNEACDRLANAAAARDDLPVDAGYEQTPTATSAPPSDLFA
jgi:ribonuclease HI